MQYDGLRRQNTADDTKTASLTAASTKFSTDSSSVKNSSQRNNHSRRKLKIAGIRDILKLPSAVGRRRKSLSEPQLRKKLTKLAERGNWNAARKLISGYEFPAIARDSFILENTLREESSPRRRRSSYRSGNRHSFSGGESSAAAAVIQAVLIEESESSSDDEIDTGENILHDVCRCQPPLDVVKTLLCALQHRRCGSTIFGTDDQGRTPLHVAATMGASSEVIDALVCANEIEARRHKMEKINAREQKETTNDAIFDAFGIDGYTVAPPAISQEQSVDETPNNEPESERRQTAQVGITDDDIYNQHLRDYLDDFMDDLDGCEHLGYADEDGFNILDDPSEARHIEESAVCNHGDGNSAYPLFEIIDIDEDDDCVSVMSDITVTLN